MLSPSHRRHVRQSEQGYILLTLILFVALLAIAATVTAPAIMFQLKREREEELIHRGTQYTRAIQHYVKKFGKFPTTLENLENTNQIRFLRRRYKDPITGKDFKLLHVGEVQTSFGGGLAGATSASNLAAGAGANGPAGLNGPVGLNGGFGAAGPGNQGAAGGINGIPGGLNPGGGAGSQILPQNQNGFGGTPGNTGTNNQPGQPGSEGDTGEDGTPPGVPNTAAGPAAANGGPGTPGTASNTGSGFGSNNQTFGGGPIMGVASTSKDKTIRIFSKKERYYQWQFYYDPSMDQGGLITTPNQQPGGGMGGSVIQGAQPVGAQGAGLPGPGGLSGQPNQPVTQPNQPNQGVTQTPLMPPEQPGEPEQ